MMKIEKKREYLFSKISKKEKSVFRFAKVYRKLQGPGWRLKLKRLLFQKNYLRYCLARIGFLKEDKVKLFWGKEITLPLADGSNFYLLSCGTLDEEELKLTKFLIKNLKENEIFYDIGASYGFYSSLANELITRGQIHAFEPNLRVFYYLKKNLSPNKNKKIFLNNRAVLDKNKKYPFFKISCSGGSTIFKSIADTYKLDYQETKIKAITLDNYTKKHSLPTFIKLDIEGGEKYALLGATRVLKKCSPVIAMEIWGGRKGEKFSRQAVNLLSKFGYKSYILNEQGKIRPQTKINFKQIKKDFENFIFKR